MSTFTHVIGATEGDQVNRGESFSRTLQYLTPPADISTVEIVEADPASIVDDSTITVTDAVAGDATWDITPAGTAKLGLGLVNSFRLKYTFVNGTIDISPVIGIETR